MRLSGICATCSPVDDSTKAGVKTILSDLQNQLVELAQASLDRLAEMHPATPKPGPLASEAEIESLATAWPSEIDLLFVEAKHAPQQSEGRGSLQSFQSSAQRRRGPE